MKVLIWADVLRDYSPGMAIAVAENKEEAIKTLLDSGFSPEWQLREVKHPYGWAPAEPIEPIVHDLADGPIGAWCNGGG